MQTATAGMRVFSWRVLSLVLSRSLFSTFSGIGKRFIEMAVSHGAQQQIAEYGYEANTE
jgi:hypothetical protein